MKIAGLSLLSILIALTGNYFAKRKLKRIEILQNISLMINYVNSQIEYTHLSVPKLLEYISSSDEFSDLIFIKRAYELLEQKTEYKTVWKKAINEYMNIYPLKKSDAQMLISYFCGLGSTDTKGQIANCKTYSKLFQSKAENLRKNAEASAKLYNCLGLLTGAMVFIILY